MTDSMYLIDTNIWLEVLLGQENQKTLKFSLEKSPHLSCS